MAHTETSHLTVLYLSCLEAHGSGHGQTLPWLARGGSLEPLAEQRPGEVVEGLCSTGDYPILGPSFPPITVGLVCDHQFLTCVGARAMLWELSLLSMGWLHWWEAVLL